MDVTTTLTREESPEPVGTDALTCDLRYETGRVIAAISGELDVASAAGLERRLLALLMLPLSEITLDLAGLSFMDSTGLSVLVRVSHAAADLRTAMTVVHPNDRVAWMLSLTRIGDVVSDSAS